MQAQSPVQTATKNSLSTAAKRVDFNQAALTLVSIFAVIAFAGCQNLQTRDEIRREQEQQMQSGGGLPEKPYQAPGVSETSGGSQISTGGVTPPAAPTPVPPPNTFLTKETPKVGLILGPGGMKAYAHIGVLKEIARARLPVKAIVGLEWGSVIGGLYAMQGQINEVEWKAFKLKEDDIPSSGILSKAIQAEKTTQLNDFFNTVYGKEKIEQSKIDFACPTYNIKTDKLGWWNKGEYKDSLKSCVPYPPYYTDNGGYLASPFAIEEAAAYLRSKGANLIIYVNVLGGEVFNSSLVAEHYAAYVLWSEAKRQASRKALPGVNLTITVDTGDAGMTDFSMRRQMLEAGGHAARDVVNKLVTQYGF